MTIASHSAAAARRTRSSSASSSRTVPRSITSHPASASNPASIVRLLSRIWPGASGEPSSTSSSPVDSTATVARGYTLTVRALTLANTAGDRRADLGAGREQQVARLDVVAGGSHRRSRSHGPRQANTVGGEQLAVLDHHDRIGARRHRRSGHDPDRLAGAQTGRCSAPAATSSTTVNSIGTSATSARADGVSVDGAVGERRDVFGGDDIGREHQPAGALERHLDRCERRRTPRAPAPGRPPVASRPAPYRSRGSTTAHWSRGDPHRVPGRRLHAPGGRRGTTTAIEVLTLRWENEGWTASGEVGRERIHYVIRLSPTWQVRQFLLFRDLDDPDLWLATDGHARWGEMNGAHRPELDGCHDIDLACTPFTNTLPIRRLPLAPR